VLLSTGQAIIYRRQVQRTLVQTVVKAVQESGQISYPEGRNEVFLYTKWKFLVYDLMK
jgi:hypothetical protein